jgi:rRNA metabolism protein, SBDS family
VQSKQPKLFIAKYNVQGESFEVFIDPNKAYEFITGKRSDPLAVVESEDIFKDARKGEHQKEEKVRKVFGTTEPAKVIKTILEKGDVPITTEQKEKLAMEKKRLIIEIISRNSIDPRTNAPSPPLRIENAMKEAKVSIDPFKGAQEQVEEVLKKINTIIPLKFAKISIEVVIPPEYANRCYSILKPFGIKSEKWLSNGGLEAVLEFPAGMQNDFYARINNATQGNAQTKVV